MKLINCIYSDQISSDILNRFKFYRIDNNIPLKKKIGIQLELMKYYMLNFHANFLLK